MELKQVTCINSEFTIQIFKFQLAGTLWQSGGQGEFEIPDLLLERLFASPADDIIFF